MIASNPSEVLELARARAREAEAQARVAEAEAQARVAEAEAQARQAEVKLESQKLPPIGKPASGKSDSSVTSSRASRKVKSKLSASSSSSSIPVRQQEPIVTFERLMGYPLPNVDKQTKKYKRKLNRLLKECGVVLNFSVEEVVVATSLAGDDHDLPSVDILSSCWDWKHEYFSFKMANIDTSSSAYANDSAKSLATVASYMRIREGARSTATSRDCTTAPQDGQQFLLGLG